MKYPFHSGQSLSEYGFCIGLVCIVTIMAISSLGTSTINLFQNMIQSQKSPVIAINSAFPTGPNTIDLSIPVTRKNGETVEIKIANYPMTISEDNFVMGSDGGDRTLGQSLLMLVNQLESENVLDRDEAAILREIATNLNQSHQIASEYLITLENLTPKTKRTIIKPSNPLIIINNSGFNVELFHKYLNNNGFSYSDFIINNSSLQNKVQSFQPSQTKPTNQIPSNNKALHMLFLDILSKTISASDVAAQNMIESNNLASGCDHNGDDCDFREIRNKFTEELVQENLINGATSFCNHGEGDFNQGIQCEKSSTNVSSASQNGSMQ